MNYAVKDPLVGPAGTSSGAPKQTCGFSRAPVATASGLGIYSLLTTIFSFGSKGLLPVIENALFKTLEKICFNPLCFITFFVFC